MPGTVVLTFEHLQAVLVVILGFSATEHYRLIEVLTDLSRFSTWPGKMFLLSLLVYTAAFTYCATDLSLRMAQLTTHRECECVDCIASQDPAGCGGPLEYGFLPPPPQTVRPANRFQQLSEASTEPEQPRPLLSKKPPTLDPQASSSLADDEDTALSPILVPHRRAAATGSGYLASSECAAQPGPQVLTDDSARCEGERRRSILKTGVRLARRVSVIDYRERKGPINVAFAQVKRPPQPGALQRVYSALDEVDYDLINCKTLSVNIYIPLILGHATCFVLITYAVATWPVYGWAAVPLIILAYAGLMNVNSLLRHLVPKPTERWLSVLVISAGLYYFRVRGAPAAPAQFSATAGDLWSVLLILLGAILSLFYAAFALGCSLQCALKQRTLEELWRSLSASLLRRASGCCQ